MTHSLPSLRALLCILSRFVRKQGDRFWLSIPSHRELTQLVHETRRAETRVAHKLGRPCVIVANVFLVEGRRNSQPERAELSVRLSLNANERPKWRTSLCQGAPEDEGHHLSATRRRIAVEDDAEAIFGLSVVSWDRQDIDLSWTHRNPHPAALRLLVAAKRSEVLFKVPCAVVHLLLVLPQHDGEIESSLRDDSLHDHSRDRRE